MPVYLVTRTEEMAVTYRVTADSPEAARELLRTDGDQVEEIDNYWNGYEDEEHWEVTEENP